MSASSRFDRYADVVIIGAGYSGLNALVTANNYLSVDQHAVIADVRPSFGGQSLDVYDYVRLHQPYQFYTAYDRPWRLPKKDRWHLASKKEILTHFQSIGNEQIATHGSQTLFDHRYIGHEIVGGDHVHVVFESMRDPNNNRARRVTVRTKRVIDAVSV